MRYDEYLKYRGYYPDICLVDWERWGDELCEKCGVRRDKCPEDLFHQDCPYHDEAEAIDKIAFEANEQIRVALDLAV